MEVLGGREGGRGRVTCEGVWACGRAGGVRACGVARSCTLTCSLALSEQRQSEALTHG